MELLAFDSLAFLGMGDSVAFYAVSQLSYSLRVEELFRTLNIGSPG